MIEPQPPAAGFSALVALVSPVSSKKNVLKPESGRKRPFSGRLNGVAFAALASSLARNGVVPLTAVSWIVTHLVVNVLPYVCSSSWSGLFSGAWLSNVIGSPAPFSTCSTSSFPCLRSPGLAGT